MKLTQLMHVHSLAKKQNEATHLVIPTIDMITFRREIGKKMSELLKENTHNYAEMKQIVIADLVSFNKKRDREVSGIQRNDIILQRKLANERANTDDMVQLTKMEELFRDAYTLLRLPGKGGKFVPILVPPKTMQVIDLMIADENLKSDHYFFQTEGGQQHYRSYVILNNFAEEFGLQNKAIFRSTKLRKFLATAAQFLDLPQHQRQWVANFLGHDLAVHDKYYRMHTDAVCLAKMTKLLCLVDSGKLKDSYQMNLDTIQPTLEDENDSVRALFKSSNNIGPNL